MNNNAFVKIALANILDSFKQEIPFIQPLYETIANSLEAHATKITVEFDIDESQQQLETSQTNTNNDAKSIVETPEIKQIRKICGFKITDNGDGFTDENIDSFKNFKSNLKKELGCKGVGRFTWLKVFDDIKIESHTKNHFVKFDFNKNFSLETITPIAELNSEPFTTISFSDVTTTYKKFSKNKREKDIDERLEANLSLIKKMVEEHLMVKLFLLAEEQNAKFEIKLKLKDEELIISNENIIKLQKKNFQILNTMSQSLTPQYYQFTLYYKFEENLETFKQYYCAAGRLVEPFTKTVQVKELPDNTSLTMLLTSKYFDERITEERNKFTFSSNETNRSMTDPIPLCEINDHLKTIIDDILLNKFPNLSDENKQTEQDCIEKYPYLAKYIRMDESKIKKAEALIKYAEKKYEAEKKEVQRKFEDMLEQGKYTNKKLFLENVERVNDMSARELAKYFLYREQIIEALKKIQNDTESCEADLHNLFMEMGSNSTGSQDSLSKYDTNLWLLDDKYLTYTKAYSDTKIKTIKNEETFSPHEHIADNNEPDLTIFYNQVSEHLKDIVVIEFKSLNATELQNGVSIYELSRNIDPLIETFEDVRIAYGYVIMNIDEKLARGLSRQSGVRTFSHGDYPVFYIYNDNLKDKNDKTVPTHIYIMPAEAICKDAENRNKTFLEILKNH